MKQLDVVVSPPAFVWDPNLTLTHVTFDLDPPDLLPLGQMSKKLQKIFEKSCFFDMVTLTLIHDLDIIYLHHYTELRDQKSHSCGDMNFFLVKKLRFSPR